MNKDLNYYMGLSYKIEIVEDKKEGGYAFSCPELKGCVTYADNLESGYDMLQDAKRSWFAACLEDNIEIPEPSNIEDFSGQFKLRIPKSLHKALCYVDVSGFGDGCNYRCEITGRTDCNSDNHCSTHYEKCSNFKNKKER